MHDVKRGFAVDVMHVCAVLYVCMYVCAVPFLHPPLSPSCRPRQSLQWQPQLRLHYHPRRPPPNSK